MDNVFDCGAAKEGFRNSLPEELLWRDGDNIDNAVLLKCTISQTVDAWKKIARSTKEMSTIFGQQIAKTALADAAQRAGYDESEYSCFYAIPEDDRRTVLSELGDTVKIHPDLTVSYRVISSDEYSDILSVTIFYILFDERAQNG